MSIYNEICVYIVQSTDQLALYSTVYCRIVYYGGRVYGNDRCYEGVIQVQGLLDDLRIDQDLLKINCDSMSAIYLAKNQIYHARMKHIDVRFHFIQEILNKGDIGLQKIHMKENHADMLTKVVPGVKFAHCNMCKELLHILPVVRTHWSLFG